MCCHCQLLGAIFTVFVDVCLEKREGILGGEASVHCLSSGSHWGEGVEKVKLVCVGESLRMGGSCIKSVFPVHLVDRYGEMPGRGGAERNMPSVATGKRNMYKVSPD